MMKIFSLIYDPITSSPFAVSIKSPSTREIVSGLTDVARDYISSKDGFSVPEYMVSTPYTPLTQAAEKAISDMSSGDDFYSLDEMLDMAAPRYVHESRVVLVQKELCINFLSKASLSDENRINYAAARFFSDSKKISAAYSIKNSLIYFDPESNIPFSVKSGIGNAHDGQRLVSRMGRSSCRRTGALIGSSAEKQYSKNYRINRRVKSLIGLPGLTIEKSTPIVGVVGAAFDVAKSKSDKGFIELPFEKSDSSAYSKPELRERIKNRIMAGSKGGKPGQWSARKAQLLAMEYEKAGGGYRGKPKKSQRSLKKWTKEKWTTSDGKPAIRDGKTTRYLPAKAWEKLTPGQKKATNSKKIAGSKKGSQFVANTAAAKKAGKKARGGKNG
jgi:hypothetical protein